MQQASPQEDNPATAQIIVLFTTLFLMGVVIVGKSSSPIPSITKADTQVIPTQDTSLIVYPPTATPTQDPNIISNPQIDESEAPTLDDEQPTMPIAMFNLENPNGWETPESVILVGSFQSLLGCDDDFLLECEQSQMAYDSLGDVWQASFELPAGDYAYRAHLNNSETQLYGNNGISGIHSFPIEFTLNDEQTVNFYYDHKTGWITDDINSLILTLPSNFQDEIGCREEWNATCFRTWMQDLEGDGIYTYETLLIPEGSWETRVALNGDINTSYGQGESLDGDNIQLWIPNIGHLVVFTWDSNLNILTIFVSNMPIRLSTDLPAIAPNQ